MTSLYWTGLNAADAAEAAEAAELVDPAAAAEAAEAAEALTGSLNRFRSAVCRRKQAFKNMPSWTFMDDLRTFHAAFSDDVGRTRAASYGPGVARLADIAADKARIIFDRAVRWYERTTELEDEGPEHEPELDAFRAAHGDV